MIIDTTSLIICTILLLASFSTSFLNPFLRKARTGKVDKESTSSAPLPEISVLITAHDDAEGLQNTLAHVLQQDYDNNYEVIVVIEQGDSAAETILKQHHDKRVYTTFVPPRSLFMSKEKLAISLGVKAAHNEWIVLIPSNCIPQSTKWLSAMARNCKDNKTLVLGYSNYEKNARTYYRFERLRTSLYLMNKAIKGTAFRANGPNIAFRKSVFISGNGYMGNLQFMHGKYDFIVNRYAKRNNTAVESSPEATVLEARPSKKAWINRNIYYIHIRKHLLRSLSFRFTYDLDLTVMYFNYAFIFASLAYSSLSSNWIVLSVAALAFALTVILRTLFAAHAIKNFGENISLWKIVPYEISIAIHNLVYIIKYMNSDKRDFTTHKL